MADNLHIEKLSFTQRPIPILADYRPIYKLAQIVLILEFCCRGKACSLLKMHLLSDALKSDERMIKLIADVGPDFVRKAERWNLEPTMNRGLQLAVAEGLCSFSASTRKYILERKGREFFLSLMKEPEVLEKEKRLLNSLGKKITDTQVQEISRNWLIRFR